MIGQCIIIVFVYCFLLREVHNCLKFGSYVSNCNFLALNLLLGVFLMTDVTTLNLCAAEKLQGVLDMENRLGMMKGLVQDYYDQLSGFDVGLTTQVRNLRNVPNEM